MRGPAGGRPTALLVGEHVDYVWQLPPLLASAGYDVDLLTRPSDFFRDNPYLREAMRVPQGERLFDSAVELTRACPYDWVIVVDNRTLRDIALRIDIAVEDRLRLAPVTSSDQFGHLSSKVGLARRLAAAGLPAPRSVVAFGVDEAKSAAAELGFPAVVKLDASAAGNGLVLARSDADVDAAGGLLDGQRLLVEEFLPGREWSIAALFRDAVLLSVLIMQPLMRQRFGGEWQVVRAVPSRAYPEVVAEVGALGGLLGLDGFANIAAREDAGGTRRYFEADARPSVWSPRGAEVGDDPAAALRRRLLGESTAVERPQDCGGPAEAADLVYFPRLTREDFLVNRSGVQAQVPWTDPEARRLLAERGFR